MLVQKVRKLQKTRLTDRYRSTESLSFVTPANFPRAMTVRRMANDVTCTMYAASPIHLRVQSMLTHTHTHTHTRTHTHTHSKCYHSHVQLVMEGEKGGDRVAMETAWAILEEVVQLLETRAHVRVCLW